jgi:hypothetical protein
MMDRVDFSTFVEDHRRALESEAAAERLTRHRAARSRAAGWLRGLADRIDPIPASPGPLIPRPRPLHARSRP